LPPLERIQTGLCQFDRDEHIKLLEIENFGGGTG